MLEVRLIGRFDVSFNGEPVVLTTRASQSLFAYLILTAGTRHRREKLAGLLWPDLSEKKARTYLRQELWRIRKAFSTCTDREFLLSDDIAIWFDADTEYWLDVDQLVKLGEPAPAEDLMQALQVYEGELLPGFYEDWTTEEREYLYALFEKRMGQLLEILEKEKRWQEIPNWSEYWLSFSPAQETAYQFLMIAYQAMGDRARTISTFDRCVKVLQGLGLEPSETTRTLVVRKNTHLNIPIPLTSFIGREKELEEVSSLLKRSRLVTLTGSGGVGKTRLAIQVVAEVIDRYPDGTWFLDLSSLNDPSYLPNTVMNLLGLLESGNIKSSALDQLISYFHSRSALLIFDNCEHLIAPCAQLVHSLLTSSAGLSVLATSREALRVPGEIPYRVPSLELPLIEAVEEYETLANYASVRLFVERAAVVSPGFAVDRRNVLSIVRICKRLDGIPLAIELAAVRTNVLTVDQISMRLEESIRLLTHGLRSAPLRHETLRATIEWSVQLLSDKERLLFQRLAVFSGGWTLEAAETVCHGNGIDSAEILDLMSQLVDKSLVIVLQPVEGRSHPAGGTNRYHSLETIRQYAYERLVEDVGMERLRDEHLDYFLRMTEAIEPDLVGAQQSEWMDHLEVELDNIRRALEWSLSNGKCEQALRLFGALGWFWIIRCHFQEGLKWFGLAMERREDVTKSALAKALGFAGILFWIHDAIPSSRDVLQKSIELYRELGNKQELSNKLLALGTTELSDGNLQEARSLFGQALAISREIGHRSAITRALFNLADISCREGNPVSAAPLYEESLVICRQLHDDHLTTMVLLNVGDFAFSQEEYSKAREYYQEMLDISLKLKNTRVTALTLLGFADIFCAMHMYSQSARLHGFSVGVLNELGVKFLEKEMLSYQKTVRRLKEVMGEDAYSRELEEGSALQLDQAITIAYHLKL